MSKGPGTRVIEEIDHGTRTVAGTAVKITELVWNDTDGRSFEVERVSDGETLTMDEAFDDMPDDDAIEFLITAPRDRYGYIDYRSQRWDTS